MKDSFLKGKRAILPEDRIYTDELRTLAWGTDAGEYRLVPRAVLRARDEEEVSRILELAYGAKVPVTFRAAGTSLPYKQSVLPFRQDRLLSQPPAQAEAGDEEEHRAVEGHEVEKAVKVAFTDTDSEKVDLRKHGVG